MARDIFPLGSLRRGVDVDCSDHAGGRGSDDEQGNDEIFAIQICFVYKIFLLLLGGMLYILYEWMT